MAERTRVKDRILNPDNSPRAGTVTFALMRAATGNSGLHPAASSVSCVLDNAGWFDVWLVANENLNPQAYYNLLFRPSTGGQENLGIYEIPDSDTFQTLAPNKITDTNLIARYKLADETTVQNLAENAAEAALSILTSGQQDQKLQKWDTATSKFKDSKITETGTGATLNGIHTADGYVGIRNADVPATLTGKTLASPVIQTPTMQGDIAVDGDITADAFVGNGAGLTGVVAAGPGGSSSNGSLSLIANADGSTPAAVVDTILDEETITRAHLNRYQFFKPLQFLRSAKASLLATVLPGLTSGVTDKERGLFYQGAAGKWYRVHAALDADEFADFDAAITTGLAQVTRLRVTSNQSLTANQTTPASSVLEVANDAVITVPTGITLKIAGELRAPLVKIFDLQGTGKVQFDTSHYEGSKTRTIYPEWFGAVGNGSTDDTAALQAAVNSMTSQGAGRVKLTRSYVISQSLAIQVNPAVYQEQHLGSVIEGVQPVNSLVSVAQCGLIWKGPSTDPVVKLHSRDCLLRDFSVTTGTGYKTPALVDIDTPVGVSFATSNNRLEGLGLQTDNNARNKYMVCQIAQDSANLTIPAISGTWYLYQGNLYTVGDTGGAALTEVKNGEYVKYGNGLAIVQHVVNDNQIKLYNVPPDIGATTISHWYQFEAGDVGSWIVLGSGGAAAYELPWMVQVTGYTSATSVTVASNAPGTSGITRAVLSPIGAGVRMGLNAAYNCDLHSLEGVMMSDCAVSLYIPSTTGQVKSIKCQRVNFGFNGFGILTKTGSFHLNEVEFARSYICNIGSGSPTDYLGIRNVQVEESARFFRSYGGSSSQWPVSIQDVRWSTQLCEADGRAIWFTHEGPLIVKNVGFEPYSTTQARAHIYFAPGSGFGSVTVEGGAYPCEPANVVETIHAGVVVNLIGVEALEADGDHALITQLSKSQFDNSTTADNTGVQVYINGTWRRIKAGAADSGGSGKRMLVIDN